MANKSYQLVAWTDKGKVRMIPSLQKDCEKPYLERIGNLEDSLSYGSRDEVSLIMDLSHAHEMYGRFLLLTGKVTEAFEEFAKGAACCTECSDEFWADSDYGYLLCNPFRSRFYLMFGLCRALANDYPHLKDEMTGSYLLKTYGMVSRVDRSIKEEPREALESRKAYYFGK